MLGLCCYMGFSLVVVLRLLILVVSHGAQALGAQVSVVAAQSSIVGSSWSRDWTCICCIGRPILYHWATRQALKNCISEIYELCDVIKPKQINTTYFPLAFLRFPHQPRAGPILLTLLFFPLVPLSYRALHGSIYSFPLVRYSCPLSAGVPHTLLCLEVCNCCICGERCIPRPPTPPPSCSLHLSCLVARNVRSIIISQV